MATADLYDAGFGSPEGLVSMTVTYDTVSLQVQSLIYSNPTPTPGTFTLAGPVNHTFTTPANSSQTIDLTSANIVCVQQQITDKFGTRTVTELPGGETVAFSWSP